MAPKNEQKVGNVRVCCRLRPLDPKESTQNERKCVQVVENTVRCKGETMSQEFQYDQVFTEQDDQLAIFNAVARPAIDDIMEGYNATILTYGQTSSGKTYTMQGTDSQDHEQHGIIPRTAVELFSRIHTADLNLEFTVKVSFIEIYMEQVSDLLDPQRARMKLQIREDAQRGFFVENVMEICVTSPEEFMQYFNKGKDKRMIAATDMNERSSRSHSVLMVTVSQEHLETKSVKSAMLYLVDLAGSEMVRKTEAIGRRLEEAKTINKSLSTLGIVIKNLTDPKRTHVPYRDSKLTRVLQESLGGNSRPTLIINISTSNSNARETLSTLRFGTRAKKIKNQAVINKRQSADDLMGTVKALENELHAEKNRVIALKNRLDNCASYGSVPAMSNHEESEMKSEEEDPTARDTSDTEAFQQLRSRFVRLEEEFLDVQLESDRRGLEIQELRAQVENKAQCMESSELSGMEIDDQHKREVAKLELSLKIKDIKYSELQSDYERLDFEHKELAIHAEKLQQQIDFLLLQESNRTSFPTISDATGLQSPTDKENLDTVSKQVDSGIEPRFEYIRSTDTAFIAVGEAQQRTSESVENPMKNLSMATGLEISSMKQFGVASGISKQEQKDTHAIQLKLEHLVAAHRQLLRKFATSELNAKEAKKRVEERDERIKKLEASNRNITESLRNQAEKHVEELIRLRDQISDFRGAQRAHFERHGNMEGALIKPLRGVGAVGPLYHLERPRHIRLMHVTFFIYHGSCGTRSVLHACLNEISIFCKSQLTQVPHKLTIHVYGS